MAGVKNNSNELIDVQSEEISTAYSYYTFYASIDSTENTNIANSETTITESENTHASDNDDNNQMWKSDVWTAQCEQKAESLLSKHRRKCHLVDYGSDDDDLANNSNKNNSYLVQKYEEEADLYWDTFYCKNLTKFFKDRHYLNKAFPHEAKIWEGRQCSLYEIGCGVGNNILPLLTQNPSLHVQCFDFSSKAIQLLNEEPSFQTAVQENRAVARVWDITKDSPYIKQPHVQGQADFVMLMFCLSAINPSKMKIAAQNVISLLKPGGVLLFRDYGRFDEAQMKLGTTRNRGLGSNFYVKHDGTRVYYFTLEDLEKLFCSSTCGDGDGQEQEKLEKLELDYIRRVYINRGMNQTRRRVWVQGRFIKQKPPL